MRPVFFHSAAEFRRWLAQHHASSRELLVGFHRQASGRGGITYPEALDEALCFGWIDGIRRRRDETSYTIRFTPRKPRSTWSNVNVRHVERLEADGRMMPAGRAAFAAREATRTGIYSFENRPQNFPAAQEKRFRAHPAAWTFWQQQPPGYRRTAIWWVISAKQEATRERRLATLIADSAAGRRIAAIATSKATR
jgi:uncharacterized protein YdeI (YjbR/CyaY-like superfamily)